MDRVDELISMCEKAECPKKYKTCPFDKAGNDCDNYCPFVELVDILKEYKGLKENRNA